jgi:hypothetical protein
MLYLVKDDIGTQIRATLTREYDGSAVDLTDSTAVFKFRAKGTTTVLATLSNSATDGQKANGLAIFSFTEAALANDEGRYQGEIEVTFDDGTVETVYEIQEFYLRDDF